MSSSERGSMDSKQLTSRPRGPSYFHYVPSPRKVSLAELDQGEAPIIDTPITDAGIFTVQNGDDDDDSDVSPVDSALNMFAHYETDETDMQNLTKAEFAKSMIDHIPKESRISVEEKTPMRVDDALNNSRMTTRKSMINTSAMQKSRMQFKDFENELMHNDKNHEEEIEDMKHVEELKRIEGIRHSQAMRRSHSRMEHIEGARRLSDEAPMRLNATLGNNQMINRKSIINTAAMKDLEEYNDELSMHSATPSRYTGVSGNKSTHSGTPSRYKGVADNKSMYSGTPSRYAGVSDKSGIHSDKSTVVFQDDVLSPDDIAVIRQLKELERIEDITNGQAFLQSSRNSQSSGRNFVGAKHKRCCKKPQQICCEERVRCLEAQIKKLEETQLPSRLQVKEHRQMCCGQRRYSLETETATSHRDSTSTCKPLQKSCCSGTRSMLDEDPRFTSGFSNTQSYRSRGARSSAYTHPGVLPPYAACKPAQLPACNNPNCPRPNSEELNCFCSDQGSITTARSGLGDSCSKCKEDASVIDLLPNRKYKSNVACGWNGHTNFQFDDNDELNHERDRMLQQHAGTTVGALNLYKVLSAKDAVIHKLEDSKANHL